MFNKEWENLDDLVASVKSKLEGKWSWTGNMRCKYVSIRVDMRDGKAILLDKDGKRITEEEFARNHREE